MWKDRILSTFTATMRFIMADNILLHQLSMTMKWKYLHTAAAAHWRSPFISHTFQLRISISFKSWQTQESIYQSKSFVFLLEPATNLWWQSDFFSSQSLILLYLFWWEQIISLWSLQWTFFSFIRVCSCSFEWGLKMMVKQKNWDFKFAKAY